MDKCPKCGAEAYGFIDESGAGIYKCGSTDHGFDPEHPEPFVSVLCLRRQLAAANERAARLVEALEVCKAFCDDGFVCFSLLTKTRLDETSGYIERALDEWMRAEK